jgi:hypothetical protein
MVGSLCLYSSNKFIQYNKIVSIGIEAYTLLYKIGIRFGKKWELKKLAIKFKTSNDMQYKSSDSFLFGRLG